MAKLTLTTDEVAAHLRPLLEQHLSDVKIYVDGDKGVVSGKKGLFIPVEIKFACNVPSTTARVAIDLACNLAAKAAIGALAPTVMGSHPYIETLDSQQCVINLKKVVIGGKKLTDFIDLKSAQIPAANGLFAAVECTFKPQ